MIVKRFVVLGIVNKAFLTSSSGISVGILVLSLALL
jgi:hypothetical protein